MKSFVVVGLGRFGSAVAAELCRQGNEVLAIDTDPLRVEEMADQVTQAVTCDAVSANLLKDLGVRDFECAIVAVGSDIGQSTLIAMNLKELGVPRVICKAQNQVHRRVLEKIGVDQVIIPEHETGVKLAQNLSNSNLISFLELSRDFALSELPVPRRWVGKTIRDLNVRVSYQVNILAIREQGSQEMNVNPGAGHEFTAQERVVVVGAVAAIAELEKL